MVSSLVLAALTLRSGLALRRSRLGRLRRTPDLRRRHLRLAKPAVAFVGVGFLLGPASSAWLRDWEVLASFHGVIGVGVALLFGAAAAVGARQVASGLGEDSLVVTLFPDSGERYLSKLNDEWLREQGLID